MAHSSCGGLNEVSSLGPRVTVRRQLIVEMETSSTKQSRIPKFGFGFKSFLSTNGGDRFGGSERVMKNDRQQNVHHPPPPPLPTATASTKSSPQSVSRSRSMRVHKSTPVMVKVKPHSNSIDHDDGTNQLLHPSNMVETKSNPSSRSNSPIITKSEERFIDSTSSNDSTQVHISTSASGVIAGNNRSGIPHKRGHIRSNSFGSKERMKVANNTATTSSRRSTVTSRPNPSAADNAGGSSGGSHGNVRRAGRGATTSSNIRRPSKPSEDVTDGEGDSLGRSGRTRRPFSFHEGSPDLNQLASELSHQLESSGGSSSCNASGTIDSNNRTSSNKVTGPPSKYVPSKLHPPVHEDSKYRPLSAAAHNKQHETRGGGGGGIQYRPRSAADVHKVATQSSQGSHGSGRSTPSSGRSTPQLKKMDGYDDLRGGGGGGARSGPSIRHNNNRAVRQPIKVAAGVGSGEDGVGLNELKGAVLLDAEDYRKMVQEVKTLKTMLLRLKRELAADGGVSPSNSVTSTVSMSSMARLKRLGGSNNGELLDKIQKLTSERDKAIHEVEEMKKSKVKEEKKYEGLKGEMEQMKNEREELTCKVNELEQHREYLIDKMERLHADKHKVEDKLNTIEKSSLYERTILEEHMMISDDDDITLYDDDGAGNDNLLCYDDEEATY